MRGGSVNSNDWKILGNLLSGLSVDLMKQILPEDVVENLEKLIDGASNEKLLTILRKVKQHFKQKYYKSFSSSIQIFFQASTKFPVISLSTFPY